MARADVDAERRKGLKIREFLELELVLARLLKPHAQFGGQVTYEIRNGKVAGMLKDVAYQIRTPDFWNSMDKIGGKASYELGGSFFDGKGQPSQSNAVSHGSPPARFRQVNVINTGRTQ